MNRIGIFILAAVSCSCAGVSESVDELATVELGAEALSPVQLERSVELGADRIPACLDFSATLPANNTTVSLKNSANGCALSIGQPGLVLLDVAALERARRESGPFDVSGIRSGGVELQKLELSTAHGSPLRLADYVTFVSVQVDGQVVLDRVAPGELEGLSRQLPASVIDKLRSSLTNNQVATADIVLTLWLSAQTQLSLPDNLTMLLVLQPLLQVNVVDAAL